MLTYQSLKIYCENANSSAKCVLVFVVEIAFKKGLKGKEKIKKDQKKSEELGCSGAGALGWHIVALAVSQLPELGHGLRGSDPGARSL